MDQIASIDVPTPSAAATTRTLIYVTDHRLQDPRAFAIVHAPDLAAP
jgi:hypothetical protein